tara:strand:- start:26 stop:202 length:177 start_codon:yes stop_codon:yes gene_type:complete
VEVLEVGPDPAIDRGVARTAGIHIQSPQDKLLKNAERLQQYTTLSPQCPLQKISVNHH